MNDWNHAGHDPADNELADHLQRHARSLDIGDTPIAAVVQRGRQRRERRRLAVGLALIATLSGTAIGTIQLLSKPTARKVVPATDSDPTATNPEVTVANAVPSDQLTPANRIDSNLAWNVVEPGTTEALGSVIWDNNAVASQQPPYLAWSTSPGKTPNQEFVPTLYRSDDGIHWQPAGGESFTQPDISMRGVGSRNGRMFAFGTAAATAPIPNGGGGEVVVDVSDDLGSSWRHITLPIDLRGLARSKGVQGVGFAGDMVASDTGVVAVGVPTISVDPSVYSGTNSGGYIPQRDGAILLNDPTCSAEVTATTISFVGGYGAPAATSPADTEVANTIAADPTSTTNVGVTGTAPVDQCTADTTPQQSSVIPWSDLGVDPTAVATMFAPRVFVSTDGEHFVEGSFPAFPDGYQLGQIDVVATANGFAASTMLYGPGGQNLTKLYTSADGMTWTESNMPSGYYNLVNVLPNGTIVAFGSAANTGRTAGQPFTAVSTDGVEWSKVTLASLLNADDAKSARLNVWMSGAGPGGITVVAGIDVDAAQEAGGFSIEKDGVRLTLTESRNQTFVATDIGTGKELGLAGGRIPSDVTADTGPSTQGGVLALAEDGTVRVNFSDADVQSLQMQQASYTPKTVVLHSTDGFNWSRDDVQALVGFDSFSSTRVQVTDSNVLVSMVNPNGRDAAGIPKTVVLVGTAKS